MLGRLLGSVVISKNIKAELYCNRGKKSLLFSNSKSSHNGCGEPPSAGPLTLQPCPTEANGARATTPVSEVGLPEPQDTSMLLSCVGTLWFCTTWLGHSLSRDGSHENVPPHQKHASEHKRALMIGN